MIGNIWWYTCNVQNLVSTFIEENRCEKGYSRFNMDKPEKEDIVEFKTGRRKMTERRDKKNTLRNLI